MVSSFFASFKEHFSPQKMPLHVLHIDLSATIKISHNLDFVVHFIDHQTEKKRSVIIKWNFKETFFILENAIRSCWITRHFLKQESQIKKLFLIIKEFVLMAVK